MHVTIVGKGLMGRALVIHAQRGGHTRSAARPAGQADEWDITRGSLGTAFASAVKFAA
jgi:prephenate dehydrogenase